MSEDLAGSGQIQLTGPVYAIGHREAVEYENGTPIVMDPGFLLTYRLNGERALLLFTERDLATEFWESRKDPTLSITTFRGLGHLVLCLEQLAGSGLPWVMLNRSPGRSHGALTPIDTFIDHLRALLAQGGS